MAIVSAQQKGFAASINKAYWYQILWPDVHLKPGYDSSYSRYSL